MTTAYQARITAQEDGRGPVPNREDYLRALAETSAQVQRRRNEEGRSEEKAPEAGAA